MNALGLTTAAWIGLGLILVGAFCAELGAGLIIAFALAFSGMFLMAAEAFNLLTEDEED